MPQRSYTDGCTAEDYAKARSEYEAEGHAKIWSNLSSAERQKRARIFRSVREGQDFQGIVREMLDATPRKN